jgi:creatinine deaminase
MGHHRNGLLPMDAVWQSQSRWEGFRVGIDEVTLRRWLDIAVEEAVSGRDEGGIPIGAALIGRDGEVLGRGHNRRIQQDDPSIHGETDAFRNAGRQRSYRGTTMVTTLSPCWYCSGLIRQFGISRVVIGEDKTFHGGHDWLAEHGVEIHLLQDRRCVALMEGVHRGTPRRMERGHRR